MKVIKLKRKKKHEEHVDESWLIPYADILTLLLALFIVLFAASEVNTQKFKAISEAFNNELQGGKGVLENEAAIVTFENIPQLSEPDDVKPINKEDPISISLQEDFNELRELQEKIEEYIKEKGLSAVLETELTTKGLILKIKERVLYLSGSAEILKDSRTTAVELSNLLVTDPPRRILIEGHTDNIPSNSSQFPSNWELSSSRAINFMKILLENNDLEPQKFSATGYGEYQPITSNDTPKGRAKNRRVEVLISPYQEHN